ncbi:hypothetical protein D3C85_1599320 [compost metagenome]
MAARQIILVGAIHSRVPVHFPARCRAVIKHKPKVISHVVEHPLYVAGFHQGFVIEEGHEWTADRHESFRRSGQVFTQ